MSIVTGNVRRIDKGDQYLDIEQIGHSISSRSLLTISKVTGGALGFACNKAIPLRAPPDGGRRRETVRHDCVTGQQCYDPTAFLQKDGIDVRSRKMKRVGVWIGLAALALQILLAPVFSGRALAMALDPLADAQICAAGSGSNPMPMDHHSHCAECCLVHCAADAGPVMAPVAIDFPQPLLSPAMPAASYARPLVRGPPSRAFPATGPPVARV